MNRRKLDIAILSDVHLGSYECHSAELLKYLKSIRPEMLILNGDFIDAKQFKKSSFSKSHTQIIQEILELAFSGTKVYYLAGNREKALKNFHDFSTATINLREKLVLQLGTKKFWIFHGDAFDPIFGFSDFWGKLVINSYRLLLRSCKWVDRWSVRIGKARMSYAGRIKNSVRQSLKIIKEFEETAVQLAREQKYDGVICGHIHQPTIKNFQKNNVNIVYMNSGDWVENLTALEYRFGKWGLYKYNELDFDFINPKLHVKPKVKQKSVS